MMRVLIVLLTILLVLHGCAPSPRVERTPRTYKTIATTVLQRTKNISTLYGEGKITVETPSFAQTGSFVLFLQKPDSLYLTLQGPFGIKVGAALLTRTEFFFYNSIENKLITGTTTEENLERILRLPLTFDDLLGLVAGGTFLAEDRHAPDELRTVEENVILIYRTEDGERRYWIDRETTTLTRFQVLDLNGTILLEQQFKNFRTVETMEVPFLVQVQQYQKGQRIVLSYSTVKLQKPEEQKFLFSIPQNAERIRW